MHSQSKANRLIEAILEQRFGKDEAEALRFGRARVLRMDIQFMDVKHMSEILEIYRRKAREAIGRYRAWNHYHQQQTDTISRLYGAAEGAVYHRQAGDAVKLWYIAHCDYHMMRKAYLRKCLGPQARVEWDRAA